MASQTKQNTIETKGLILDAAKKQFSVLGFSKVTMEEIAAEAGMGKASLYYYFTDKDSLFQAVVKEEMQNFEEFIGVVLSKDIPAPQKIREYVKERFRFFNRLLSLNFLEQKNTGPMKPVLTRIYTEFRDRELKVLHGIFKQGKAAGEFEIASAERIAEAFVHLLAGLRIRFVRHSTSPVFDTKEFEKLVKEVTLITDIFIRGIGSRPATPARRHTIKHAIALSSR